MGGGDGGGRCVCGGSLVLVAGREAVPLHLHLHCKQAPQGKVEEQVVEEADTRLKVEPAWAMEATALCSVVVVW